jgi:hypothetical protein
MHFLVENFESKLKTNKINFYIVLFLEYFFRAFKSILKCQRIKQYKPSTNFYRISSTTTDQLRLRTSNSCDLNNAHLFRKSEPITTHRVSSDSQHNFTLSKTNRNIVNNPRRISRNESMTSTTIQKSLSTPDNTSPWHLRKSINVR